MYNLLISIGVAVALFVVGWVVAGTVVAGVIPAILGLGAAYFLLARRSGKQLQAIMNRAMAEFSALQGAAQPRTMAEANRMRQLQLDKIAKGKEILHEGFALAPWQFLVGKQIHAQLGAIDYMQMEWAAARVNLEQAWVRNWQAMAMLACIDHREKKHDAALQRMEETKGSGKKDPLFWGIYAWIALKSGDRERAVRVANEGLQTNESSDALKAMAAAIANKKKVKVGGFEPGWFQFFPEHSPQYIDAQKQANKHGNAPNVRRGGYSFPHPRR